AARSVELFAARSALDIESVGGIVADKLVERGLVREPLDLFELKTEQLAKLNLGTDEESRVSGEENATKAIRAIERARTLPLSRLLFALAIPVVGRITATQLATFHETIEDVPKSPLLLDVLQYHEKRDDAGRSNRKNRNARRPCHRQREQENRLRPRRRRTRKQIRQGERTRRANYRRTRVSQDAVTQLTALSGCAAEKNLRSKFRAWVARRNRARAGSPADLLRACRER